MLFKFAADQSSIAKSVPAIRSILRHNLDARIQFYISCTPSEPFDETLVREDLEFFGLQEFVEIKVAPLPDLLPEELYAFKRTVAPHVNQHTFAKLFCFDGVSEEFIYVDTDILCCGHAPRFFGEGLKSTIPPWCLRINPGQDEFQWGLKPIFWKQPFCCGFFYFKSKQIDCWNGTFEDQRRIFQYAKEFIKENVGDAVNWNGEADALIHAIKSVGADVGFLPQKMHVCLGFLDDYASNADYVVGYAKECEIQKFLLHFSGSIKPWHSTKVGGVNQLHQYWRDQWKKYVNKFEVCRIFS